MYNWIVRISVFLLSNDLSDNSISPFNSGYTYIFKFFAAQVTASVIPFSWALPTPGLRNKLGFSGNTINAEGIR